MTGAKEGVDGTSSTTEGYIHGGYLSGSYLNVIEKFTYAASANATDVGDLTSGSYGGAGTQV